MTDEASERELFETWALSIEADLPLERIEAPVSTYANWHVTLVWHGWQNGRAPLLARIKELEAQAVTVRGDASFQIVQALVKQCDENPPAGDSLYFVQQARELIAKRSAS